MPMLVATRVFALLTVWACVAVFGVCSAQEFAPLTVVVHTGSHQYAGTIRDLFIRLHTSDGSKWSQKFTLEANFTHTFREDTTSVFELATVPSAFEDFDGFEVSTDSTDGWCAAWITVKSVSESLCWASQNYAQSGAVCDWLDTEEPSQASKITVWASESDTCEGTCAEVPNELRLTCNAQPAQNNDMTEAELCQASGCCYSPPISGDNIASGLPSCYYSTDEVVPTTVRITTGSAQTPPTTSTQIGVRFYMQSADLWTEWVPVASNFSTQDSDTRAHEFALDLPRIYQGFDDAELLIKGNEDWCISHIEVFNAANLLCWQSSHFVSSPASTDQDNCSWFRNSKDTQSQGFSVPPLNELAYVLVDTPQNICANEIHGSDGTAKTRNILIGVLAAFAFLVIVASMVYCRRRRKRASEPALNVHNVSTSTETDQSYFKLEDDDGEHADRSPDQGKVEPTPKLKKSGSSSRGRVFVIERDASGRRNIYEEVAEQSDDDDGVEIGGESDLAMGVVRDVNKVNSSGNGNGGLSDDLLRQPSHAEGGALEMKQIPLD